MAKKYISKAEGTDPIIRSRNILVAWFFAEYAAI